MQFNGWKKIKDYNPDGEDNGQYATVDGMPSWLTLNWRGSYTVKKYLTIQAGIENILDRNYRYFASGFSAPGRNFILALRTNF
jgi:hemoglobin/transferrin/lactoferrin receptor protein